MHPHPDHHVKRTLADCPHCGANLRAVEQKPHAVYERIELPPVRPEVTRVVLPGGRCPECGKIVVARPLPGLERGSPFGQSIATLALYLHYTQAISLERLRGLFGEVFGLEISEGALVNIFRRARERVATQTAAVLERIRASRVICSDETSARVAGRTWWEGVFVGEGAVLHELAASRAKSVPERARRSGWRTCSARSKGTGSRRKCAWRTKCATCSTCSEMPQLRRVGNAGAAYFKGLPSRQQGLRRLLRGLDQTTASSASGASAPHKMANSCIRCSTCNPPVIFGSR